MGMSRLFRMAWLAAMLLLPVGAAWSQGAPTTTGARAYWCKSPNGVAAMQLESCAPGTELRSEPLGAHGRLASPPPPQPPVVAGDPSVPRPAAAARPVTQSADTGSAVPVPASKGLKIVLVSVLMLLGVGVVLAVVRKYRTRT